MIRTVIVPLDGSAFAESALEPAAAVARHTGAELVGLVVGPEDRHEDQRRYVKDLTADLEVSVREPYLIPADDPAECIANAAEAEGSLVVMTSHGRGGVRRAALGSVAEAVLQQLPRPLLLVGPRYQPPCPLPGGNAMIPLDGSGLADSIVPAAIEWCRAFELQAWTVSVVDPAAPDKGPTGIVTASNHVRAIAGDIEAAGVPAQWEILHHRHAAGPLVTFAAGLPASVIALTTHARSGLGRVALGSTAARLVHDATVPLLIQHPDEE